MTPTLLLWDIDGTLLHSGGSGLRALEISLREDLGITGDLSDIDWAGRTDRWITTRVFEKFSIPNTAANADRFINGYLSRLPAELDRSAHILPGITALLDAARDHPTIHQGLLTGNLQRGARVKLGHFALWDYFPFGAFADDSPDRNDLGPHALARATAVTGHNFDLSRVWIIGDTPHDIACARAIGARALAVATGHHTLAQLAAHAPDALLDNLADRDAFWSLLT